MIDSLTDEDIEKNLTKWVILWNKSRILIMPYILNAKELYGFIVAYCSCCVQVFYFLWLFQSNIYANTQLLFFIDYITSFELVESYDVLFTFRIIQGWPNTYTFTKAMCEEMLMEEGVGLPICIFRPAAGTYGCTVNSRLSAVPMPPHFADNRELTVLFFSHDFLPF